MTKGQMTGFGAYLPWIMILVLVALIITAIIVDKEYQLPSNFKQKPIRGIFSDILLFLGIPGDWLFVPAIIYLFFVPFIGIFVIVYGFLGEMRIFPANPRINIVLALVFAFATIPIGAFVKLVSLMFSVLGIYSVGAFGLLFFFGVIYVIIARMGGWEFFGEIGGKQVTSYAHLDLQRRYEQTRKWLLDMQRDYSGDPNPNISNATKNIADTLKKAEKSWHEGNTNGAINELQSKAASVYSHLRKVGVHVRIPPR